MGASQHELSDKLARWAPGLLEEFSALAYVGGLAEGGSADSLEGLDDLVDPERSDAGSLGWVSVLRERKQLSAPALLAIVERFRHEPAVNRNHLTNLRLQFAPSLANASFRTGDALYEDAKSSLASSEIDLAIGRFQYALAEFRFAIESGLLSDSTRRIAAGKYATAAALIGRWVELPTSTLKRALLYSAESMQLGNLQPETVGYRLELLLQRFDTSGSPEPLEEARRLCREIGEIARGTELTQCEIRLRLAARSNGSDRATYLRVGRALLDRFQPRTNVDRSRRTTADALLHRLADRDLPLPPTALSLPGGVAREMAASPSVELWDLARYLVERLEQDRLEDRLVPSAVTSVQLLRQIVDGPAQLQDRDDVKRYREVSQWLAARTFDRHLKWEAGTAALSDARKSSNRSLAEESDRIFSSLAERFPSWPLPMIGRARATDFLAGSQSGRALEYWGRAAALALRSSEYQHTELGGKSRVFAVADARRLLSQTFVFKPTTRAKAEHEAALLSALRNEIQAPQYVNRFEVPRSLAIVRLPEDENDRWVHVTQRSAGYLLRDLSSDQANAALDDVAEFLAVFHRAGGSPPPGKSAWGSLKDSLRMWTKALIAPEQVDPFVGLFREAFPAELPLVRKRDAHASNWLVNPAGRLVAIDLESSDFLPVGYDLAQLVEDDALLPADRDGWERRLALFSTYLSHLDLDVPNVSMARAYSWFALSRSLRLATEAVASKAQHRHARAVCEMVIQRGHESVRSVAQELQRALARIETEEEVGLATTHDRRRLSKAMAYMLRHHGPTSGVPLDASGFADLEVLAAALGVSSSEVLAVAEQPSEHRYEVRHHRIRALYGHSVDVTVEPSVRIKTPAALFHGSSWESLDSIVAHGLTAMSRKMVHLTNSVHEAFQVGSRKGSPVIFEIRETDDAEPVADSVWVTRRVQPARLRIVNPYLRETGDLR